MLILLALFACSQDPLGAPLQRGQLTTCLAGPSELQTGEDLNLDITGVVVGFDTGADMNLAACPDGTTVSVDIQDADGQVWSVGWTVLDSAGADVTPNLDLQLDDTVDLTFRWKLVWGTTAGFVLQDDAGLVAAADEGTWGGALTAADLPGFEVLPGNYLGSESTECQPIEYSMVDFVFAAETVSVAPVGTSIQALDGQDLSLMAIDAMVWGESPQCTVSDQTDVTSWAVFR